MEVLETNTWVPLRGPGLLHLELNLFKSYLKVKADLSYPMTH